MASMLLARRSTMLSSNTLCVTDSCGTSAVAVTCVLTMQSVMQHCCILICLACLLFCCYVGAHDAASTANSTTVTALNTTAKCVVLANSVNKKAELSCVDTPATKANNHADKNYAPGAWSKAPPCMETPTKSNTVMDTLSRLWGLTNSKRDLCAHKASNGATLKYAGYEPLEWNTSASCSGLPNSSTSMPDSSGR